MISCFRISSKASLRTILPLPTMASARWLKTMQDKEYPVVKKTKESWRSCKSWLIQQRNPRNPCPKIEVTYFSTSVPLFTHRKPSEDNKSFLWVTALIERLIDAPESERQISIGVNRGALIKVWLYERVKQEKALVAESWIFDVQYLNKRIL